MDNFPNPKNLYLYNKRFLVIKIEQTEGKKETLILSDVQSICRN